METMRERFASVLSEIIDTNPRAAVVLADIGADYLGPAMRRHPGRVINVGIREQLLIGVTSGLALAGLRPVAHSFAPFLIERPFEQIKLDLVHQGACAVLVSAGGSYDYPFYGRTHMAPGDVALLDTLPGWTIHVPGHPAEAGTLLRQAVASGSSVYLRLSVPANERAFGAGEGRMVVLRTGGSGTVVAVGPLADAVLAATQGLDVTVLYAATVRPFDAATLRATLAAPDVVVVEPYLAGTSVRCVAGALSDVPHRVLGLGVWPDELRRYGTWAEHEVAHGLDPAGLRAQIGRFLAAGRAAS